jgi:tripartite-type tricarboxylate transporter receptor subunit TctC
MRSFLATVVAAIAFGAGSVSAQEDYPAQPIKIIVSFSAGGPTDTVTRLVAEPMSGTLGQQVLVENVTGAGGTLGASHAAQAEPDGYTILMHHIGMATSPTLYSSLPYDPLTSFAPIGLVTEVPMTLVGRSDFPPEDLQGVIDYVKENGEEVLYAHAGIGAASQLCGLLFMQAVGTALTTVPYQGTGPAMTDLLGGQVDLMCDQTTNTASQIKADKIKAYAVFAEEPLEALPEVPTAASAGLEDMQISIWHGLYAPAGTPEPIIQKLSDALQKALQEPEVIERFAELGTTPVATEAATPAALKEKLAAEIERWEPVIKEAGVSVN